MSRIAAANFYNNNSDHRHEHKCVRVISVHRGFFNSIKPYFRFFALSVCVCVIKNVCAPDIESSFFFGILRWTGGCRLHAHDTAAAAAAVMRFYAAQPA